MNKAKRYGVELKKKAIIMRNVLKDGKYQKSKENHFRDYKEQDKLYKKSLFMIKLGEQIK